MTDWHLSLKLVDRPKSTFHFPEMMPGDVPPGGYRVATLKQLVAAQLPDSVPDPELIGLSATEIKCERGVCVALLSIIKVKAVSA